LNEAALNSAKQLLALIDVINQTVGDALSDLLLVETVLHANGWSVTDWDAAYVDLPNRQMKVGTQVSVVYSLTLLMLSANNFHLSFPRLLSYLASMYVCFHQRLKTWIVILL